MGNTNGMQMELLEIEYRYTAWGELIYGTREELQRLGLGDGHDFPANSRRKLRVVDPRGFECVIDRAAWRGEGLFCASIRFPGREPPEGQAECFAPGVTCERLWFADLYSGASDALIKAGLVRAAQFPGSPGIGKTTASFDANGSFVLGRAANWSRSSGMTIRRATASRFHVYFYIDDAEKERRTQAGREKQQDYERRMAAMPRPSPLVAPDREAAVRMRRAGLRLAWSRPLSTLSLTSLPKI